MKSVSASGKYEINDLMPLKDAMASPAVGIALLNEQLQDAAGMEKF